MAGTAGGWAETLRTVVVVLFGLSSGWATGLVYDHFTRPTLDDLLNRGRVEIERGRPGAAVDLWLEEGARVSGAEALWQQAGIVARKIGRHEDAITLLRRVPATSPLWSEVTGELGLALLGVSRLDEAETHLRESQRLRPESGPVREELRWLCFNTFRTRAVERLLLETLAADPDDFASLKDLHLTEFRAPLPREGRPFLDTCESQVPGQVCVLRGLAWCDWHTGDQTAALDKLTRALDAALGDVETRLVAAEWALEQGRDAVARELLKLQDEPPGAPPGPGFAEEDRYWGLCGKLQRLSGRFQAAADCSLKASELRPWEAAWTHQRGLALADAGEAEEARRVLARGAELERAKAEMADIVFGTGWDAPTADMAARMARLCETRGQFLAAACWKRQIGRLPKSRGD